MEAVDMARVSESTKQAHRRLDVVEAELRDVRQVNASIARMEANIGNLTASVGAIQEKLDAVSARPGKRWDKLAGAAITALATGLVAALVALILK